MSIHRFSELSRNHDSRNLSREVNSYTSIVARAPTLLIIDTCWRLSVATKRPFLEKARRFWSRLHLRRGSLLLQEKSLLCVTHHVSRCRSATDATPPATLP